ncbi:MAG TPA: hypothetical protein VGL03_06430 [Thermoanaerobaculia bacterium]|jgi:hypothetical protein
MDFELFCPCCNARLKIDADLKAVIDHEAPKTPRKFSSVDDALGALKGQDHEREKKFAASVEAEKSKKDVLNRKFEELFEKTKHDTSKPIRDIDLD